MTTTRSDVRSHGPALRLIGPRSSRSTATPRLAEALRIEFEAALAQGYCEHDGTTNSSPTDGLRMRAIKAARRTALTVRSSGEIGDNAFHRLEEEIDRIELSAS